LNILYQPYWCEENIWHLAQHSATAAGDRLVLVITGAEAQVACWQQKAGVEGAPVLWDYHVVLATRQGLQDGWQIWDLDGRAGLPVPAETWLRTTFPFPALVPESYQPRFAVISVDDYLQRFGSDRAHMRDPSGSWLQPPPPWAEIGGRGLSLADALAQARQGLDLAALKARLR